MYSSHYAAIGLGSSVSSMSTDLRSKIFDKPNGAVHKSNAHLHIAILLKKEEIKRHKQTRKDLYTFFERLKGDDSTLQTLIKDCKSEIKVLKVAITKLDGHNVQDTLTHLDMLKKEAKRNADTTGCMFTHNHETTNYERYESISRTIREAESLAKVCLRNNLPEYFQD